MINSGNEEQIKEMLRNAFVTDDFKNITAQGNHGRNKYLLTQKAIGAWNEYFGRYGFLKIENKKKLIRLVETVLKNVENQKFRSNKIDIIVKALNVVIPLKGSAIVEEDEEDGEEEQQASFVPESIQNQQHEEMNTSTNSLFGFLDTMVANGDEHRDYELENLLGIEEMIPEAVTSSSSASYGGTATSSSSSSSSNERLNLQNEIEMLRRENDQLQFLQNQVVQLQQQSNDLKAQVDAVEVERDGFKAQVQTVEVERDGFKAQVQTVEVERDGFKAQVQSVEVERDGLKAQVQSVEVERDGFKAQLQAVEVERDGLKEQVDVARRHLEEEMRNKESFRTQLIDAKKQNFDTQYALKQWKELRGTIDIVERTLLGAVAVEDIYDAETEVEVEVAVVGEKRKREDNDSECSRESKRARTDDINVLILNKLAYQAIIAHDASKAWRSKIQSLYEEFRDDKFLRKVRAIFTKAEGKTLDATVKENATIMKAFVEEIANV